MLGQRIYVFKRLSNYGMLLNCLGNLIEARYFLVVTKGPLTCPKLSWSSNEVNVGENYDSFITASNGFAFMVF